MAGPAATDHAAMMASLHIVVLLPAVVLSRALTCVLPTPGVCTAGVQAGAAEANQGGQGGRHLPEGECVLCGYCAGLQVGLLAACVLGPEQAPHVTCADS